MKKLFSVIIVFFLFFQAVCQSDGIQIVMPKKIYVGDTAELHYLFSSELDLFSHVYEKNEMELPLDRLSYESDTDDFLIKKAVLQKNGKNYTLIITFVPWITGFLKIPDFILSDLILIDSLIPLKIAPQPVEVLSMLSESADTPLKEPCPPLLLPGTMYVMYALLVIFLLFVAVIVNVVVKRNKIRDAIERRITLHRYARNARKTVRSLNALLKSEKSMSDAEFAMLFENRMREYLSVRYGKNFKSQVSSSIGVLIEEATGGFLDDEKREACFSLVSLFVRADYIRFARNSVDSERLPQEKYRASFNEGEKKSLIENACSAIFAFELNKGSR
ncbi:MAG: hypothetical protein HDR52_05630 [Treponema sp.]|nr:hypothetical protein [Treponema sp.]